MAKIIFIDIYLKYSKEYNFTVVYSLGVP